MKTSFTSELGGARTDRWQIRVSPETNRLAAKLAAQRGLSLGQFVRGAVSDKIEEFLVRLEADSE